MRHTTIKAPALGEIKEVLSLLIDFSDFCEEYNPKHAFDTDVLEVAIREVEWAEEEGLKLNDVFRYHVAHVCNTGGEYVQCDIPVDINNPVLCATLKQAGMVPYVVDAKTPGYVNSSIFSSMEYFKQSQGSLAVAPSASDYGFTRIFRGKNGSDNPAVNPVAKMFAGWRAQRQTEQTITEPDACAL